MQKLSAEYDKLKDNVHVTDDQTCGTAEEKTLAELVIILEFNVLMLFTLHIIHILVIIWSVIQFKFTESEHYQKDDL